MREFDFEEEYRIKLDRTEEWSEGVRLSPTAAAETAGACRRTAASTPPIPVVGAMGIQGQERGGESLRD